MSCPHFEPVYPLTCSYARLKPPENEWYVSIALVDDVENLSTIDVEN
jgi:hypothetical protein